MVLAVNCKSRGGWIFVKLRRSDYLRAPVKVSLANITVVYMTNKEQHPMNSKLGVYAYTILENNEILSDFSSFLSFRPFICLNDDLVYFLLTQGI